MLSIDGELERLAVQESSETLYSVPIQSPDCPLPAGSFGTSVVPTTAPGWQSSNVVPRKYAKIFAADELYDEDDEKDRECILKLHSVHIY
ncbi:unnamed protein product [Dibothriocephalus latus]|uniref:Uncharacterized protein n=1 Tax=Dibothriocephalus latus TaxID=60516 RepID=A0A3P7LU12_DIBLA|nr:unnamed protein product [Dibothriocephalus latus]